MTTKELVLQVLEIDDVIERLCFVQQLQLRLVEIDSVEKVTQDEARERMARWPR